MSLAKVTTHGLSSGFVPGSTPTIPVRVFLGEELTIPMFEILRGDWRWVLLVFHLAEALLEFLPASAERVCLSESGIYPVLAPSAFPPGIWGRSHLAPVMH